MIPIIPQKRPPEFECDCIGFLLPRSRGVAGANLVLLTIPDKEFRGYEPLAQDKLPGMDKFMSDGQHLLTYIQLSVNPNNHLMPSKCQSGILIPQAAIKTELQAN